MEKVHTLEDLKRILKMSEPTIKNLIRDGKLKKLDTSGAFRVSDVELNRYLKGE